jgi:hypothetical protein
MSLITSNDSNVFGQQSPFHNIVTDNGLKNTLFHLLVDFNSRVVRKRGFDLYLLANKSFPNSVMEINQNIRYAIGQLLTPFTKLSVRNDVNSVLAMKPSSYIQGEIELSNAIAHTSKVKNTAVLIMDNEKTTLSNQKGITTYITRSFLNSENSTLEHSWSNGFITFNDPSSISILIAIPKQYIASLSLSVSSKNTGSSSLSDSIEYLNMIRDIFIVDLVKSIFTALFNDEYHHRINSDIAALNSIFQEKGDIILTSGEDDNAVFKNLLITYRNKLKGFKDEGSENLVYNMLKFIQFLPNVTVNPLDFYKSFIDLPTAHIESIFNKLTAFNKLNKNGNSIINCDFSNSLSNMNIFLNDEERGAFIYGLKLVRYLPFLIFNTYAIGGGNFHDKLLRVLTSVSSITSTIGSAKSARSLYAPLGNFILSEIQYFTGTFYKQMSSPMKVNNKSRHVMTELIKQSISLPEETEETIFEKYFNF